MSDTAASLHRKITSAGKLQSVVRTMKAMAASSVGQYENAVRSLDDYDRTVRLGLAACFRQHDAPGVTAAPVPARQKDTGATCAVVFGSDQGLIGQFNDVMAEFVAQTLGTIAGKKKVWVIGERVASRLDDIGLVAVERFVLPNSIGAITPLVGQILVELERYQQAGEIARVYLFHNRPESGALYLPVSRRLLPPDEAWRRDIAGMRWPTKQLPEALASRERTLAAFIREYLFVSLFRTCAESLASENTSRLAAMQRIEKNIDELLEELSRTFHRLRQSDIDEELFDVIAGFEALTGPERRAQRASQRVPIAPLLRHPQPCEKP